MITAESHVQEEQEKHPPQQARLCPGGAPTAAPWLLTAWWQEEAKDEKRRKELLARRHKVSIPAFSDPLTGPLPFAEAPRGPGADRVLNGHGRERWAPVSACAMSSIV